MDKYEHMFFPGRMQPPHIGHIAVLKKAIKESEKITILIYEVEKINSNNPFTGNEVKQMVEQSLEKDELQKCEIIIMPYFETPKDRYDFVSNKTSFNSNSTVLTDSEALVEKYSNQGHEVINPHKYIEDENVAKIRGSDFRKLIMLGEDWKMYAACGTEKFNEKISIKERVRQSGSN